ncbi:MAG: hypothetical protein ACYS8W_07970 [Planctomycetota bacterium]|jgi:hypothetical protein
MRNRVNLCLYIALVALIAGSAIAGCGGSDGDKTILPATGTNTSTGTGTGTSTSTGTSTDTSSGTGSGTGPFVVQVFFSRRTTENYFNYLVDSMNVFDNLSASYISLDFPNPPMVWPEWTTVTQDTYDAIIGKLDNAGFYGLDPIYDAGGKDTCIYTIEYSSVVRSPHTVQYYVGASAPAELIDLVNYLEAILDDLLGKP